MAFTLIYIFHIYQTLELQSTRLTLNQIVL